MVWLLFLITVDKLQLFQREFDALEKMRSLSEVVPCAEENCLRVKYAVPWATSAKRGNRFLFISHLADGNDVTARLIENGKVVAMRTHLLPDDDILVLTGAHKHRTLAGGKGSVGFARGRDVRFALNASLTAHATVTIDLGEGQVVQAPVVSYGNMAHPCGKGDYPIAMATLPRDTPKKIVLVLPPDQKGTPFSTVAKQVPYVVDEMMRKKTRDASREALMQRIDWSGQDLSKLHSREEFQRFRIDQTHELVRARIAWSIDEKPRGCSEAIPPSEAAKACLGRGEIVALHAIDFELERGRVINFEFNPDLTDELHNRRLTEEDVPFYDNIFDYNGDGTPELAIYEFADKTCGWRIGDVAGF